MFMKFKILYFLLFNYLTVSTSELFASRNSQLIQNLKTANEIKTLPSSH